MISIARESGQLLRVIPGFKGEETFGLHELFGLVSERSAGVRERARKHAGLRTTNGEAWQFNFRVVSDGSTFKVSPIRNCQVTAAEKGHWKIQTPRGIYLLSSDALPVTEAIASVDEDNTWKKIAAVMALVMLMMFFIPTPKKADLTQEIIDAVTVKIKMPEIQKSVKVPEPSLQAIPQNLKTASVQAKRAIQQNLGFLGLLGKKDLTKALGGMPLALKDVSAGAGAGGKEGSGGETLVGLGQGVKRTTVGNTGVAGLGGIGTKGAGGGAGGYGNMMVGSGEGKGLTSLALSQDVVLEGGLDRSVIQATIAKYLSQIRACYEEGLRKNKGLMGQVSMAFEISGAGTLNYARVHKSSLGDSGVESCISTKMMNWQFPKPTGGVNVKVNYPFMLRPSSS